MTVLLAAALFFVGIHVLVSGTALRGVLVKLLGERIYIALFALASLAGIVWLCVAWSAARYIHMWEAPGFLRALSIPLVLLAFLLVVIGVTTPNPTAVGAGALFSAETPARGILRVTRHPFLWGVAVWAAIHLVTNGDAASIVFFGAFLALALHGIRSLDARKARQFGERWMRFAAVTSNIPFLAIAQGRNRFDGREIGVWRPLAAVAAFVAFLVLHARLFGAVPLPP